MKTQLTTTAKAPRRSTKDEARDAFTHHIGSARELVAMLTRHLDDHLGVAPDEVNWANAGDAAHLVELLKQAARGCNLIAEE
ncbi:MAG: hypothetical protein ACFUZC_07490 [Chthoniobacteraceae bacterium]